MVCVITFWVLRLEMAFGYIRRTTESARSRSRSGRWSLDILSALAT